MVEGFFAGGEGVGLDVRKQSEDADDGVAKIGMVFDDPDMDELLRREWTLRIGFHPARFGILFTAFGHVIEKFGGAHVPKCRDSHLVEMNLEFDGCSDAGM